MKTRAGIKSKSLRESLKRPSAKILVILSVVLLSFSALELTGATSFVNDQNNGNESASSDDTSNESQSNIDYSPASPEDNKAINQQKESDPKQQNNDSALTTSQPMIILSRASAEKNVIYFRSMISGIKSGYCQANITGNINNATAGSIEYQDTSNSYVCNIDMSISGDFKGKFVAFISVNTANGLVKSNELEVQL